MTARPNQHVPPCADVDACSGARQLRGPSRRRARRGRRGASAVEFALVAPVFVLLVFGIIEVGRALMVQQIITNASREGARRAIIEHASDAEVQQVVDDYLGATSVAQGVSISVTPTTIGPSTGFGDPISVTVSVPYSAVSWMPTSRWLGGAELSATTTMRAERPE